MSEPSLCRPRQHPNTTENWASSGTRRRSQASRSITLYGLHNLHPRFKSWRRLQPSRAMAAKAARRSAKREGNPPNWSRASVGKPGSPNASRLAASAGLGPGEGDLREAGRLVHGEEVVLRDVAVAVVLIDSRERGGWCDLRQGGHAEGPSGFCESRGFACARQVRERRTAKNATHPSHERALLRGVIRWRRPRG